MEWQWVICWEEGLDIMALGIMTLAIMTLGITALGMTLIITALAIMMAALEAGVLVIHGHRGEVLNVIEFTISCTCTP